MARAAERGFTLLETVVTLAILSAIAGILAVAFRMASASVSRGEETSRESARLRAGIALVERAVRSADALTLKAGEARGPFFRGERDRLRFLSASPPSAHAGGGIRLVALAGAGHAGLVLAEASPFRIGGGDDWEGTAGARPVLPGAREVAFSYSAGPDERGAWEWVEAWDGAEAGRLPAAVRVELTSAAEDGAPLKTSFVVPVPAGG